MSDVVVEGERRRSSLFRFDANEMSPSEMTLDQPSTAEQPTNPAPASANPRTPLPKKQMAVVCLVTFVEPLQFGVLLPFVFFMVQGYFPDANPTTLGTYVGLITSAFCIAQLVTALPWGWLSDRIGRKPVLLIGLSGNAIFMSLFGVAGLYWQAVFFRTACGALNGNVGVAKSIIGEITDDSNRSLAFALWETAFGLGAIVGPMIGGLLADPTKTLPFLFAGNDFLRSKPYFLPCIACALFSIGGLVLTLVGYRETLNNLPEGRVKRDPKAKASLATLEEAAMEQASHPALIHRGSTISLDELPRSKETVRSLMTSRVLLPATAYGLWALIQVFFDETVAIYAVSNRGYGAHGLGLSSRTLGIVLSITGVTQVFAQAILFPPCERQIGIKGCLKAACIMMAIFVVATGFVADFFPMTSFPSQVTVAVALAVMLIGRTIAIVFGYISIMILINNSAPSPSSLGTVHGIGQMACSAARAVGPAFAGVLWTHSAANSHAFPIDYHLPFLVCPFFEQSNVVY
ncbi:major facilitator superfamily domain-containing protein [Powellomyces hirtus]|nr:major facilitator superfamily domain-containing protein [Powellomyces hirtus]